MRAALDLIAENRLLGRWAELLDRNPRQLNGLHEADAELMPMPDTDRLLAVTIDTIAEEIALGIYRSPETIGWMGAVSCLSDLAAVGADPIGVVVSVTLPTEAHPSFQRGIARGLSLACRAAGTFVLGGDTNHGERASVTGCAIGTVCRNRALRRIGCMAGELVYATGPLGAGAAVAARAVLDLPRALYAEDDFRPRPRLAEARHLAPFATCAMDTSDGLVATLDQLSRLNRIGFDIDAASSAALLEPGARRVCDALGESPVAMLAAHHGEYELVFTVPSADRSRFEAAMVDAGSPSLLLGRTTAREQLHIDGKAIDAARIRNLAEEARGDMRRYLRELVGLV